MEEHARFLGESSNEVLKEFIETYEFLPELWDVKHEHYLNKHKRNAALGILLEVLKKSNPVATKVDVRKKINTLRSNYRRELKKVVMSKACAANEDEIYQPTSSTFYSLTFLGNAEVAERRRSSSIKEENHSSEEDFTQASASSIEQPIFVHPPAAKKTKLIDDQISKNNELLERVSSHLSNNSKQSHSLATVWSLKLQKLDPMQRIYAEKAINDILFEAALGNLDKSSVSINESQ